MTDQPMPRVALRALPIALLCVALTAALAAAQEQKQEPKPSPKPWISVASQPPFLMSAERADSVVPLLVTLSSEVAVKDVSLTLLEVRYDKVVDESLMKSFVVTASIDRGAGRGPAILIAVAKVSDIRPGEYQLLINAKAASVPTKPREDVALAVTLERPGVEFEQPGKVSIDVLYPFPYRGEKTAVVSQSVRLVPTPASKFSRVTAIEPYAGPFKTAAGRPSGTVDLTSVMPVEAGRPLLVTVTPKDFPAGVSTGTIEIRGRDLKTPRSVDVEIRARQSSTWVLVLIASGLIVGYLLRVVLQHRVEVVKARAQSTVVLEDLHQEIERTPDQKFNDALQRAGVDLQRGLNDDDRTVIEGKAAKAREALTAARADLQRRIDETHTRLKTLVPIGANPANLPPEMADIVQHAGEVCARCADLLDRLNETEARSTLDVLDKTLAQRTPGAFAHWQTGMPWRFREMEAIKFLLRKPAADELSTALNDLGTKVTGVVVPQNADTLVTSLAAVRAVHAVAVARLVWLSEAVKAETDSIEKLFLDRGGGGPEVAEAQRLGGELVSMISAAAMLLDPAKRIYEPPVRDGLIAVYEKLSDSVRKTNQSAKQEELAAFDTARAEHRYRDALEALPRGGTVLKFGPSAAEEKQPVFQNPQPEETPVPRTGAVPTIRQGPIELLKAHTFGELAKLGLLQAVLVGILTTGLGYVLFAEDFAGTLKEFATVFMWGFTFDISVNKLIEIATPLTSKVKA